MPIQFVSCFLLNCLSFSYLSECLILCVYILYLYWMRLLFYELQIYSPTLWHVFLLLSLDNFLLKNVMLELASMSAYINFSPTYNAEDILISKELDT